MSTSKNKTLRRLSAVLLSLVMIIFGADQGFAVTLTAAETTFETIAGVGIEGINETCEEGKEWPAAAVSGTEDGDIVTYEMDGEDYGENMPAVTDAGTYSVTAEISEDSLKLEGLTVTGLEGVYTEENGVPAAQEAVRVENQGNYDLQYQLDDGDGVISDDGWTDTIPTVTDAGSYIVWVKAAKEGCSDIDVNVIPAAGAETPYNVYIAKAEPDLSFNNYEAQGEDDPAEETVLTGSLPFGEIYDFSVSGAAAALTGGTVTYEIELSEEGIAAIDEEGLLTVDYPGEIKVTAALSGDDNYNECTIEYRLNVTGSVSAAGEYISFENFRVEYVLGTSGIVSENEAAKKDDRIRGDIIYSMESVAGLSIDADTGSITVNDYEQLADSIRSSGGTLDVEVTALKEQSSGYGEDMAAYILHLTFEKTPETPYILSDADGTGGWYKTGATVTPADGYLIAETAGGAFAENIVFSDQGTDTRYVYLKDTVTGGFTDRIEVNIKIDSVPAQNLSIQFSEPNFLQRLGQTTFFYNSDITITFSAEDATSGIDYFVWTYISERGDEVTQKIAVTTDGSKAVAVLVLPANEAEQLHGRISFTAVDKASNTADMEDDHVFIVDTISPGLSVKYQGQAPYQAQTDTFNGVHFFNSDVTVELAVTETNFYPEDVVVRVSRDGAAMEAAPSWNGRTGTFTLSGDGDYQVFVEYTDKSGNPMESYASEIITVDTVPPEISVEYNEAVRADEGKAYYNGSVDVTVRVEEVNFYSGDVKVTISKDGGSAAAVTPSWTDAGGDIHTGRFTLTEDGHYIVRIEYTDKSHNSAAAYSSGEIVIDSTAPVISVTYNNPAGEAGGALYYDGSINGTITIAEANFYLEDVSVMVSRSGGAARVLPVTWSGFGSGICIGTFSLTDDADYIVTVTYTDRSGNAMTDYTSGRFIIDTKIEEPAFTINGVRQSGDSGGAYNDSVNVTFSFADQNYKTAAVTLTRTRFDRAGDVTDEFISVDLNDNGGSGSFSVPETVENDGTYLLTVTMTDKAGHSTQSHVRFTVNRFGSVYAYSDYLCSLIKDGGRYIRKNGDAAVTEDLVITEYNADRIEDGSLKITITRDGEIIDAEYTDFPVDTAGWHEYVYTISKDNFAEDGVYSITISSEDAAGNTSTSVPENSIDENGARILDVMKFTVDTTAPEIRNIMNLEEKIVNAPELNVMYTVVDAGGLAKIEIYVDGQIIDTVSDFSDDNNSFTGSFALYESSDAQSVRLVVTDLAGNVTDTGDGSFDPGERYVFNDTVTVSTNFLVRWYANTPVFLGSVCGAVIAAAGVTLLIAVRRRKNKGGE